MPASTRLLLLLLATSTLLAYPSCASAMSTKFCFVKHSCNKIYIGNLIFTFLHSHKLRVQTVLDPLLDKDMTGDHILAMIILSDDQIRY